MEKYRSPFVVNPTFMTKFKKEGSMWRCGFHTGEDWGKTSNRVLVSPADGTVIKVNQCGDSYGNHVVIRTFDQRVILMAHMRDKPIVVVGQKITAGSKVGVMGSSGNSTCVHLHIEVENAPYWEYAKNLLKPSNYIDFYDVVDKTQLIKNGDFVEVKKFTNTSGARLPVYAETSLTTRVGSLDDDEVCECLAVDMFSGNRRALVRYAISGTSKLKVGYVDATRGKVS